MSASSDFANLLSQTEVVPAVNQVELHPFFTQQALRDFHAANGIVTHGIAAGSHQGRAQTQIAATRVRCRRGRFTAASRSSGRFS